MQRRLIRSLLLTVALLGCGQLSAGMLDGAAGLAEADQQLLALASSEQVMTDAAQSPLQGRDLAFVTSRTLKLDLATDGDNRLGQAFAISSSGSSSAAYFWLLLPLVGGVLIMANYRSQQGAFAAGPNTVFSSYSERTDWNSDLTPACLKALGLSLPCSEADVKQAYRSLAKTSHPDRGGDAQQFLALHSNFEKALKLIAPLANVSTRRRAA